MNISIQRALVLASSLLLLLSLSVAAQDYTVVPGERVGSVRLGATRSETTSALGKASETKRWRSGLIRDSWLGPEKPNSEDPQLFLNVVYQSNRIVQIEFNDTRYSTAEGISIGSTLAQFRSKHKRPRVKARGGRQTTPADGRASGSERCRGDSANPACEEDSSCQDAARDRGSHQTVLGRAGPSRRGSDKAERGLAGDDH